MTTDDTGLDAIGVFPQPRRVRLLGGRAALGRGLRLGAGGLSPAQQQVAEQILRRAGARPMVPVPGYPELKSEKRLRWYLPADGQWHREVYLPRIFAQDFLDQLQGDLDQARAVQRAPDDIRWHLAGREE